MIAGSGPSAITYIALGARVVGDSGSASDEISLLESVVVRYASGEIRVWGLEGAAQSYTWTVLTQIQAPCIGFFVLIAHLLVLQ